MKLNATEDRKVIKDIIYKNLGLIERAGNKEGICQDLADAILVYFIEKKKTPKGNIIGDYEEGQGIQKMKVIQGSKGEVCECGKCHTIQNMEIRRYGKKPEEYTLYCSNCKDNISPSICKKKNSKGDEK